MRGGLHEFGVVLGFLADARHGVHEGVELLFRFRFRRFDQQALGHQQREVGGRGVAAVVEQALGHVHGRHAPFLGLAAQRDDELVAGAAFGIGQLEPGVAQARHQVVGVEGGVFAHPRHAAAAKHLRVGEGAQQDAGVAHEG